jgi:hypothetical protein
MIYFNVVGLDARSLLHSLLLSWDDCGAYPHLIL